MLWNIARATQAAHTGTSTMVLELLLESNRISATVRSTSKVAWKHRSIIQNAAIDHQHLGMTPLMARIWAPRGLCIREGGLKRLHLAELAVLVEAAVRAGPPAKDATDILGMSTQIAIMRGEFCITVSAAAHGIYTGADRHKLPFGCRGSRNLFRVASNMNFVALLQLDFCWVIKVGGLFSVSWHFLESISVESHWNFVQFLTLMFVATEKNSAGSCSRNYVRA